MVLQDDLDLLTLEALQAQPPGLSPLAAVRAAVAAAQAGFTAGGTRAVPADHRADHGRAGDPGPGHGRVRPHHRRHGRGPGPAHAGAKPDDVAVRALSGAIFGVILASTLPVLEQGEIDLDAIFAMVDTGLAQLEAGFTL